MKKEYDFIILSQHMEKATLLHFYELYSTPTPWLTLLSVLGKSRVKQNWCVSEGISVS